MNNLRVEHRAGIQGLQREVREMRDAMAAAKAAKWLLTCLGGLVTFAFAAVYFAALSDADLTAVYAAAQSYLSDKFGIVV